MFKTFQDIILEYDRSTNAIKYFIHFIILNEVKDVKALFCMGKK